MEYAGFWRRVGAFLIDYTIVVVATLIVAMLLGITVGAVAGVLGLVSSAHADVAANSGGQSGNLLLVICLWLYYALQESSAAQATIGKKVLGIKVTDVNGGRIDFLKATIRHFCKYISGFILGIGYLMVAFTAKKQGLHDMIAKCLVVRS